MPWSARSACACCQANRPPVRCMSGLPYARHLHGRCCWAAPISDPQHPRLLPAAPAKQPPSTPCGVDGWMRAVIVAAAAGMFPHLSVDNGSGVGPPARVLRVLLHNCLHTLRAPVESHLGLGLGRGEQGKRRLGFLHLHACCSLTPNLLPRSNHAPGGSCPGQPSHIDVHAPGQTTHQELHAPVKARTRRFMPGSKISVSVRG